MVDAFAIEPLSTSVTIEEGSAALEVDVTNMLDRHVRVGVEVRGDLPFEPSWVRLEPTTFGLERNESRRVELAVNPPAGADPGECRFTLRVYDVDRPADAFAASPPISVVVRRQARRERPPATGLLAAVIAWFAGALGGALLGATTVWRLVASGPAGEHDTVGEAIAAAFGAAFLAMLVTVALTLVIAWVVAALSTWLALRLRGHSRPVLTGVLAWGLSVPWIVGVSLALFWMDGPVLLGWLALVVLLVASPPLVARLFVVRVLDERPPGT